MARQPINIGTPNGNDGDFVRDAFSKAEDNFIELYNNLYYKGIFSSADDLPSTSNIEGDFAIVSPQVYDESGFSSFLELGQSNMEGRSGDTTNPNYPFNSTIGALSWDAGISATVTLNTLRGGAINGSHANYFGDKLFELSGNKAIMIEAASGGSGLAQNSMQSGTDTNHWGPDGVLRGEAETMYGNASSSIPITKLTGILWTQGERDAQRMDTEPTYTVANATDNMRAVIEWMQSTWPGVSIYISELGAPQGSITEGPGWQTMRDIQHQMTTEYDGVYVVFTGAKNFPLEGKMEDDLHYNYQGYQDMGEAFASYIADQQSDVFVWNGEQWSKIGEEGGASTWDEIQGKPSYLGASGVLNAVALDEALFNPLPDLYTGSLNDIANNSVIYAGNASTNRPTGVTTGGFVVTIFTSAGSDAGTQFFHERLGNSYKRNRAGGAWNTEWKVMIENGYPTELGYNLKGLNNIGFDVSTILGSGAYVFDSTSTNLPTSENGYFVWNLSSEASVNGKLALSLGQQASQPNIDSFYWQSRLGNWFQGASREWATANLASKDVNNSSRSINYTGDLNGVLTTGLFSINSDNVGSTNLPSWFAANSGASLVSIAGQNGIVSSELIIEYSQPGTGTMGFRNYDANSSGWQSWQQVATVETFSAISFNVPATSGTGRTFVDVTVAGVILGSTVTLASDTLPMSQDLIFENIWIEANDTVRISLINYTGVATTAFILDVDIKIIN